MGIPRTGPAVKAVLGLEGSKHTDQGLELKLVLGDKSFLDGTGDEPVLGKPVYYPYLLDDTWLVYQDDEDGETLHLYGLGSTCDERITEYRSYCPIAYDKYLYFTDYQAEDEVGHLCRLDTDTWEKEDGQSPVTGGFFITEGCIYLGGGSITAGPDVLTGDEPTTSAANPGLQGRGLRGPLRGQRRRRDSLHAHQGHPRPLRRAERQALARRLAQSPKSKAAWALRKGDRT